MSIPQNREDFAQFCLRKLGAPVININVSEEQVDDAIDQALYYYGEYHMEGSDVQYYTYQVTNQDIANKYIVLPANIIGAVHLFPMGDALNTNSLFNMRYQFVINDLYNISNVSLIPYFMVMNHVQFLEEMLVGMQPIRFNRHNNILYIDMDWSLITEGEFLVVKCYSVLDPAVYSGIWMDRWLQDYATALIKERWGGNLRKMVMPLPGGSNVNGQEIYNEAKEDIAKLEKQMISSFSLPVPIWIGPS